jgi:aspartyl/asparaginyl-tRNA synthetase
MLMAKSWRVKVPDKLLNFNAKDLEIYGLCPSDYPMQKKGQSFEYMRQYAHLRLRTNTFGAVMRIRHNMAIAIHKYFHDHGFFYFHTLLLLQQVMLKVQATCFRLPLWICLI